jgi:hypothetical protein
VIKIDSTTYNIKVLNINRRADFLDKSAGRTANGVLKRKLLGVYFNYSLSFGVGVDSAEYALLYEKLTEATEFHTVEIPYNNMMFEFEAYFSEINDSLLRYKDDNGYWTGLTVDFIAKEPAKIPTVEE